MKTESPPKRNHKLEKVRESRGFQGFEIAKRLGMDLIRYMTIEMEWEEQERSAAEVLPHDLAVSGLFPCLSIRQPWVWIITHPEVLQACNVPIKDIENRDWTTAMRGLLRSCR